ncbi:hypothetical protein M413DRAFT_277506 [Hebeloma cylindrosporum]|uniref:Uncharacterized protein n=1 Tax=Hebeloma cylindrosporum TaxID=76867 RepID=A0A0C3BZ60_HEBCY|nr:hypothetical protein M413DRAFT_277506 [Hebeloma cylindrosporum h7]
MPEFECSDLATAAITPPQEDDSRVPSSLDDNDNATIRVRGSVPGIDTSIFAVFADFDLDLSCLSPPSSPTPSTSELPPSTPSPPPSRQPSPILSRSISFASHLGPLTTTKPSKKSKKSSSSANLSATAPTGVRGSWPLIKYAGRGTPIDRSRRLEWGGFSGEGVAEDGLLFSSVRSASMDSAARPSERSNSPEWDYRSPLTSSISHSSHSRSISQSTSHRSNSTHEPPPELAPLEGLGSDKVDEWDSIMKTVLSPTTELPETMDSAIQDIELVEHDRENTAVYPSTSPTMSPEQIEQLNNGLEIDLGLNAALDLGLGQRGGMNWFDLGLLPTSDSGRESPSVYSSRAQTPRPSSPHGSEHRSTTSTKAEKSEAVEIKSETAPWWRKMLSRIRRVQTLIIIHKNRF